MPKKMAVSGSKAPRMAVTVAPTLWMAAVVQRNEMAVGISASARMLPHSGQPETGGRRSS